MDDDLSDRTRNQSNSPCRRVSILKAMLKAILKAIFNRPEAIFNRMRDQFKFD
jgi:hypothetical protein